MYELNVRREDAGTCPQCRAPTVNQTCERIDAVLWLPLYRTIRRTSRCEACHWWSGGRIKSAGLPRTAGVRSLILLTYVLVIGAGLALIPYKVQREHTVTGYAAAPATGDIWDVNLSKWPGPDIGFTQARVDSVTEFQVVVSMCDYSYRHQQDTDDCDSFTLDMDPIARRDIVALRRTGAISAVEREGDDPTRFKYFGAWILAVLALFFVHARRSRRVLT